MTFPQPRTRFVGREQNLCRLAAVYRAGAALVTLWGPPGMGKTRLAIELCRRAELVRDGCAPRVFFCDLALARNVGDVCAAVANGLGIEPTSSAETELRIGRALAGLGRAVVVLDNFEQVAEQAAQTVGAWAELASEVFFVVTSRERLRIAGEITEEVLPLGPEAVELFLDRARAATGAAVDAIDPDTVAKLVARLEGIPLAIELAAARMDVLGAEGLLCRLERPLELLGRGARDAGANHATLRHAIDSSYQLLGTTEQRVFAQTGVFRGGFSLEAAEAVIVVEPDAPVLDVLQSLRDRSLLRCVSESGAVRFALFDSVRAYALDVLSTSLDAASVRARHARYFLGAAHQLVAADHGNLADAIRHALDADLGAERPSQIAEIVAALERIEPSLVSDAMVELLECVIATAERSGLGPQLIARAHHVRSRAIQFRGRLLEARTELERALDLAGNDTALAGNLWTDLGVLHHQLREMDRARTCYETALRIHEGRSDQVACGRCLGNLGAIHHDVRQYDAALELYQRALSAFRSTGERRLEGIFLTNMAVLLEERGAHARARSTYLRALERLERAGDPRLEAITRTNLGLLCHELGQLEEARISHERALASLRALVDPRSEALCLGRLAMVLAALGRIAEAASASDRAQRLAATLDDPVAVGVLRLFRAFVDLMDGASEDAVRQRLDDAREPGFADGSSLVDVSDDARTASRLIAAALAKPSTSSGVLVVGPEARWFTPPDGDQQNLGSRQVLRRLLLRFVEQHREAPHEGLTLDALREAGWPGERLIEESAANRVHVALTELRRRGLKRWIVRHESRYLLDPELRIDLSDG